MNTLPLFFNLSDKAVLIIGGGEVAHRKAALLVQAGASIVLIARNIKSELFDLLKDSQHTLIQKDYESSDLAQSFAFVIVATNDNLLNERIYHDAHAQHLFVNVVDTPHLCDFIFPAIIDRSPVVIGVSSNGKAPVLARLIRAKIESIIPPSVGKIAKLAGEHRKLIKERLPNITARRRFWERVFTPILDDGANTVHDGAQLVQMLDDFKDNKHPNQAGEVYIVGAGAGSADLLTFKALRLMQQADVVLYDALVPSQIVDLCRRDSDKIFVGKKRSCHTKTQEQINELLVTLAKSGKRVLRLKGGDPFIFGRGGEEMLACQSAGIHYTVVNGISSALAASAGAGIPLTHRKLASSVRFMTACFETDSYLQELKSLYHKDETLVFYMGLHALEGLTTALIKSGLAADTPVAIVSNASLDNERVLTGSLKSIYAKQQIHQLPAPAIIIVGEVVKLHAHYES